MTSDNCGFAVAFSTQSYAIKPVSVLFIKCAGERGEALLSPVGLALLRLVSVSGKQ